jgi:hypothetical protein
MVVDADWSRLGRRLAFLGNKILLWDDAAVGGCESWLDRNEVATVCARE